MSIDGEHFSGWSTSMAPARGEFACHEGTVPLGSGPYDLPGLRDRVRDAPAALVSASDGVGAADVAWAASWLSGLEGQRVRLGTSTLGGGVRPAGGIEVYQEGPRVEGSLWLRLGAGRCGAVLEDYGGAHAQFDWRGEVDRAELAAALTERASAEGSSSLDVQVAPGWSWSEVMAVLELARDLGIRRISFSTLHGSLSRAVIQRVVRSHLDEIRGCYEEALEGNRFLEGRVVVRWIVDPTGEVSAADVSDTDLGDDGLALRMCIINAVRSWRFPEPDGGGIVIVNYPFVLSAI